MSLSEFAIFAAAILFISWIGAELIFRFIDWLTRTGYRQRVTALLIIIALLFAIGEIL